MFQHFSVLETPNTNDGGDLRGMASNVDSDSLSRDTLMFLPPSESGRSFIQDVPITIPHDQQKMIDNISSLISEVCQYVSFQNIFHGSLWN